MKNLLTIMTLIFTLSNNSFAASRVDEVISLDAKGRLDKIEELTIALKKLELSEAKLQKDLKIELIKNNKQEFYVNVGDISAAIGAIAVMGTGMMTVGESIFAIAGFINSMFGGEGYDGKGFKKRVIIGGSLAAAGAVVAAGSLVGVYLNRNEAKKITEQLPKLHTKILETELSLLKEVKQLCKEEPNHKLCY